MDGDALLATAFADLAGELGVAVPEVRTIEGLGRLYESQLGARDRQRAGAHYTPRALAEEVVEHALAPLTHGPDGTVLEVEQLLDLRVADIAAGTGVFLLASARYLAARVVESGGGSLPEALRAVVGSCLYGADLDPTAARLCRLSLWLLVGDPVLAPGFLEDRILVGDALLDVPPPGVERPTVDWLRQFPEIAARGGFDVVLGNPPFLGVKRIRDAVGRQVRDAYARHLLDGESGRSDLVVFFLARAGQLSRDRIALVLPDAVTEGDTARFGLDRLERHGFVLERRPESRPWPGEAGVRICLAWLSRPAGFEAPAGATTPRPPRRRSRPDWMPHGHQASIVLGKSLVLSAGEAAEIRAEDARAAHWIRDYLSGDDVVSTPGPTSTRQVLDLGGTDLETLLAVPPIARRLEVVRRERDAQLPKYPQLANRWWGFLNRVDRLYDEIGDQEEVIAFSKHAKYLWPVVVRTGPVFSNGVIVYPTADRAVYGFLASTPHRLWATAEGGSRLNQSHRYNPSRMLRTYPFPRSIEGVRAPGSVLADAVRAACDELGVGVTELLNRVHAGAAGVLLDRVRVATADVDRAVLAAHGIAAEDPVAIKRALDEQAGARTAADR